MILLIRMKAAAIRAVKTTLNSIMFLLILLQPFLQPHFLNSLNSIMFLLIPYPTHAPESTEGTLNSIMFLLIPDQSSKGLS